MNETAEKASAPFALRITPTEKRSWELRAKRGGRSLNTWIRDICNESLSQPAEMPPCAVAGCVEKATFNSTREMIRRGTKPYCISHKGGRS